MLRLTAEIPEINAHLYKSSASQRFLASGQIRLTTTFRWPILLGDLAHFAGGGGPLNSADVAQLLVEVASDKLAEDIVMLDLRQIASFADYFVIMSAESSRQIQALEEDLTQALKDAQVRRFHREGTPTSGWVLLDFSDVIAHIFGPAEREFYTLERLWSAAPQVVRVL